MTTFDGVRFLVPAALLSAALTACAPPPAESPDAGGLIQVAVSVPPQAYFVDRIGGERVKVEVLVPPGAAPDTWDPTPQQFLTVGRARLYVAVGHPDFPFEKKHLTELLHHHPEIVVVDMSAGIDLLEGVDDGHGHRGSDPHVWVAPATVARAARNIVHALVRVDPEGEAYYESRLADFLADVDALDREIRAALDGLEQRHFLVQHPAWGYFAAQYGLYQTAIEQGGKEPGPAALVELIEHARRDGVQVVFVARGFSDKSARTLAHEIDARVVEVDPLAYDWLDNLRRTAAAFREALDDDL